MYNGEVCLEYTPGEQKQDKKPENDPMETTVSILANCFFIFQNFVEFILPEVACRGPKPAPATSSDEDEETIGPKLPDQVNHVLRVRVKQPCAFLLLFCMIHKFTYTCGISQNFASLD